MKLIICALIFFLLPLLFSHCDLVPSDGPVTSLSPKPVDTSITIDGVTGTEITNTFEQDYTYRLNAPGRVVVDSKIVINDVTVGSSPNPTGVFHLSPLPFEPGARYSVTISLLLTSGTHSLADRAGKELETVTRTWSVLSAPQFPAPVELQPVTNNNGSIQLTWNAYTGPEFLEYYLLRWKYDAAGNQIGYDNLLIQGDKSITTLTDHGYVGWHVRYELTTVAGGQHYVSSRDYDVGWKPNLQYTQTGNVFTVKWKPPVSLYANIQNGYLTFHKSENQFGYPISLSDSVITVTGLSFGDVGTIQLQYVAATNNTNFSPAYQQHFVYGKSIPSFGYANGMRFVDGYFYYLSFDSTRLYKLNAGGDKVASLSNVSSFQISDNGNMIGYVGNDLRFIDPVSLTPLGSVTPPIPNGRVVSFASNGLVALFDGNGAVAIMDSDGRLVTQKGEFWNSTGEHPVLTPDGTYLRNEASVYSYNGSSFDDVGTMIQNYLTGAGYASSDPHRLYLFYQNQVQVTELPSVSPTTALSQPNIIYCNVDSAPASNKIGCRIGSQFTVYDASDFSVVKTLDVSNTQDRIFLHNNTLLCATGSLIKLSELP